MKRYVGTFSPEKNTKGNCKIMSLIGGGRKQDDKHTIDMLPISVGGGFKELASYLESIIL